MLTEKEYRVHRQTFQPLTYREIDQRIENLMTKVAASVEDDGGPTTDVGFHRPRWITPRELVDRMSQFLVYN